jgi:hypothetical protein
MKRIPFVLSVLAVFAGTALAQNQNGQSQGQHGPDSKLDGKLNNKVSKGNPAEKVRVIIQRATPAMTADKDE